MDLSVVIITLNNKKLLEPCLASIFKFTKNISFEVIVTDNGSTDGTPEMVSNYPEKVTLIANKENLGFSKANNKGLKIAKGRYCLILNDDTYIAENTFAKIVGFMDGNKNIGICGPRLLNIDGSLQHQGSLLSSYKWKSSSPTQVPMVIGACLFIRKDVLDKIGLFDENLFFYNDDLDLCIRTRKAGYKICYAPIASVYHYGGASSKKIANMKFFVEGIRGGLYFCKKHYGIIAYSLYRAFVFAASLVMASISAVFYPKNKEKFMAYRNILLMALTETDIPKT
jgi:GT2 family glycosyltransferase